APPQLRRANDQPNVCPTHRRLLAGLCSLRGASKEPVMAGYPIYLVHDDGRLGAAESLYFRGDYQAVRRLRPPPRPAVRAQLRPARAARRATASIGRYNLNGQRGRRRRGGPRLSDSLEERGQRNITL